MFKLDERDMGQAHMEYLGQFNIVTIVFNPALYIAFRTMAGRTTSIKPSGIWRPAVCRYMFGKPSNQAAIPFVIQATLGWKNHVGEVRVVKGAGVASHQAHPQTPLGTIGRHDDLGDVLAGLKVKAGTIGVVDFCAWIADAGFAHGLHGG
jgi:hypothetical protein